MLMASAKECLNASLRTKSAMTAGCTPEGFQAGPVETFHLRLQGHHPFAANSRAQERTKSR
jgi:hypothetical protein